MNNLENINASQSELMVFLNTIEKNLNKKHDADLVKGIFAVINKTIDVNDTKKNLISKLGDADCLLNLIKTECENNSQKNILTTYGEKAVKRVLLSIVPSSLMIGASLLELALT